MQVPAAGPLHLAKARPYEVASLNDEVALNAVELAVLVALWHTALDVLTRAEAPKVFGCFRAYIHP